MTFRDEMLALVHDVRAVAGSTDLDQRPTQVTRRLRTWSGGKVDVGTSTDVDVVLPQRFTVKVMSAGQSERVFGAGGTYRPGQYVSAAITPPFPGCGYTLAELIPGDQPEGTEVLYLLSSNARPSGINGVFRRVGEWEHRPYRITLFLERSNRSDEVPTP